MNLLYRGIKNPDEFLEDYIHRIARFNGFLKVKVFEKLLVDLYSDLYEKSRDGLKNLSMHRLALEGLFKRNIPVDEFHRVKFRKFDIWTRDNKICKECIKQESYIRFYWRLKSYKKCHLHGIPLENEMKGSGKTNNRSPLEDFLGGGQHVNRIITKFSDDEDFQSKVIDEIDRVQFDQALINAIYKNTTRCVSIQEGCLKALENSISGKYTGKSAQERVVDIVKDIDGYSNGFEYLIRIVALTIGNRRRDGIFCAITMRPIHEEYIRFANYFIGSDSCLSKVLINARNFIFDNVHKISVDDILDEYNLSDEEFKKKIQITVYYVRWVQEWNGNYSGLDLFLEGVASKPWLWKGYSKLLGDI